MVSYTQIRKKALSMRWDDVGITHAKIPIEDQTAYLEWLKANHHGELSYMENALRIDPTEWLPGAQTAVIFLSYYKQEKVEFRKDKGVISAYARGRTYQNVHKKRLKKIIEWLEVESGQKNIAKGFSDTSPLMEKALAVQAGLGWFGKNTLLIHRKLGTFTFISGFLTTLTFKEATTQLRLPRCGSCQKCLDACPTGALLAPYQLNASKCLAYHTIESKAPIPKEIREKNPGYAFGCDICQDVCPHNARKPLSTHPEFQPKSGWGPYFSKEDLNRAKKNPTLLYGTPLQRRKIEGLEETLTL